MRRFAELLIAVSMVLTLFALCSNAQSRDLSPAQLASIDRYVTGEMARQRIPGAEIGIYRDGHAVLEKGYGIANIELGVPVRPETLMQSGSTGKQFAATAVMMLVEQGKVGLEDSLRKYFTDAPESWQAIKIKNLLSHTSGLAEYESEERAKPGGDFDLRLDFTEDELARKIEKLPIEFQPGDKWDYRNTNYVLLGILIHRVTGTFYCDYLHEKIFAPLGMRSTRIISDRDVIPNRAAGYEIEGGQLKNQKFVSPTFNSTADGTLYFNVVDLEKWDRALYGTSLLTKASLDRMWTPFVLNDGKPNPAGYGFAWAIGNVNGHRLIEHGGAWQGFTCSIARYVDDKLTVVVLTNLDSDNARPGNIEHVVAGLVEPALMPKPAQPIADAKPEIASMLHGMIEKVIAGADVSSFYATEAAYHFQPGDAAEMRSSLPADWATAPMVLIRRSEANGLITSGYRLGKAGDTRRVMLQTDTSGKIRNLVVMPDPDNRQSSTRLVAVSAGASRWSLFF